MPEKTFQSFSEIVIATILSVVSANLWVRFITHSIDSFAPRDLFISGLLAGLSTIAAILILYVLFNRNIRDGTFMGLRNPWTQDDTKEEYVMYR